MMIYSTYFCFRILVQSSNVHAKVTLSILDPAAGSTDASSSISYPTSIASSNLTVQLDWHLTADTRSAFGQEVYRTLHPALEAVKSRLCPDKDLFVLEIKVWSICLFLLKWDMKKMLNRGTVSILLQLKGTSPVNTFKSLTANRVKKKWGTYLDKPPNQWSYFHQIHIYT